MEPKIRLSWIKGLGPFWALGFLLPVWDLGSFVTGNACWFSTTSRGQEADVG